MDRFFRLVSILFLLSSVASAQPAPSSKVDLARVGGNVITTTVPVSGTVGVTGTVGVSGTVPVSGTVGITGTVPVSGTVGVTGTFFQATQPVSAVSLPLPTGAALDATLTGGTQKTKIIDTGGTNVASVSAGGAVKVDNSGVTQPVAGDTAAAASDSGNPVKIGGVGRTTNPSAVTDGQRVNGLFDKLGKQISIPAIRVLKGRQVTTITASTAETTIVTADATNFLDIYCLILTNTSATATNITIKDSTAGTTVQTFALPAADNRGFCVEAGSAIPQTTVNNNWTATSSASVTSVIITAYYVKNL